ncbi:uncharacterized protein PS065_020556 [Dugong dugon]
MSQTKGKHTAETLSSPDGSTRKPEDYVAETLVNLSPGESGYKTHGLGWIRAPRGQTRTRVSLCFGVTSQGEDGERRARASGDKPRPRGLCSPRRPGPLPRQAFPAGEPTARPRPSPRRLRAPAPALPGRRARRARAPSGDAEAFPGLGHAHAPLRRRRPQLRPGQRAAGRRPPRSPPARDPERQTTNRALGVPAGRATPPLPLARAGLAPPILRGD